MSKNNGTTNVQTLEFQFPQPKEKQSLGQLIYNSKEGTYFGRTPSSWAKILFFYAIFYIVLAGLMSICMQALFSTLKENEPKWKLDKSLIGINPGLGFRPLSDETDRGSLIKFNTTEPKDSKLWIDLMNDFLLDYENMGQKQKFCYFNQTHNEKDVCVVDVDSFGPCSKNSSYGYLNASPCVFLKLNKIFDWLPAYYDNATDLPEAMPAELKAHIAEVPDHERQQIWVSCSGQHGKDKEALTADIKFYPTNGFPAYYYPFQNQAGYRSPLIAVQFAQLPLHQTVNIECRAWAKNIFYSGSSRDRKGSVAFQLFLD